MASYLRLNERDARRGIAKARKYRLRNSLMNNQGLGKETAKALANEAIVQRKPK